MKTFFFFLKEWKCGIILFFKDQELEIRAGRGRGNIFFTMHYLYCLRSTFTSSPPAVSITLPMSLEEAAKPAASIWKQLRSSFQIAARRAMAHLDTSSQFRIQERRNLTQPCVRPQTALREYFLSRCNGAVHRARDLCEKLASQVWEKDRATQKFTSPAACVLACGWSAASDSMMWRTIPSP